MVDVEEKKSKLVKLLTALGDVQMEQGNYHGAIEHYEKILSLGFEDPVVYSALSNSFIKLERVDTKALNIYRKALAFNSRNKDICEWLSQHYLRMNRRDEEAVEVYTQALRLQSVLAGEILPTLIHIHLELNNTARALEVAQIGMDFPEFREEAINYFLQLSLRQQPPEAALQVFKAHYKRTREFCFMKAACQVLTEKQAGLASSGKKLNLSEEDCDLANRLLISRFSLTQFEDLQFYTALATIFQYSTEFQQEHQDNRANEYEFFFTNQSPEVVLKRGFTNETAAPSVANYLPSFWNLLSKEISGEAATNTESNLFNKKRVLLGGIFQIVNFRALLLQHGLIKAQKLTGNLVAHLLPLVRKNSKFQLRFLADAVLFLAPFHPSILPEWVEILRETEKLEFQKPEAEQCRIFVSLHLIQYDDQAPARALDQFHFLLNLNSPFRATPAGEGSEKQFRENQLFLSQELVHELRESPSIQLRSLGLQRVKYHPAPAPIFQLEWSDPLERFKAGMLPQLGRFEILSELGRFPVHSVYRGRDNLLERIVLIKTVRKINFHFRDSDEISLADEFLEETRQMGSLNHRNIIMIYDAGQEPGFIYLAREFFEGKNLNSLRSDANGDANRVIRIFIQICSALKYAHQRDIYHKNLKPTNVILSDLDEVKVTDFGEMYFYLNKFNTNGQFLEDLVYRAPEQILEESTDGRTDIYALGVMLYEILFGAVPFAASDPADLKLQILNHPLAFPAELAPEIHPGFREILTRSLAKDASNRYSNIQEMIRDFYTVLRNE